MLKFIAHIICLIIYPFSFLLPRNGSRFAFGSYRGKFNDNSKYMFIELSENHPELEICWLSQKRSTVKQVRSLGLCSQWVFSPAGIMYALTSKYWVVNSYSADILFCLSGRATVINLWHGVGLKRCEFNITSGPLYDRYVKKTIKEHITHPEAYRRPDFMVTVSNFQTDMFSVAFRLPESRCLKIGYPRNAIMLYDEARRQRFINKYESEYIRKVIENARRFQKVYIYMPTWRDSQSDVFSQGFDLDIIDSLMKRKGYLMILKPHPNTKVDRERMKGYGNILLLEEVADIYPVLPYCNVLITDYSSILYDFILMPDKDVILYLKDYADFQDVRGFYYPFDENVIGKRVYDFSELCTTIGSHNHRLEPVEREKILSKFWGDSDSLTSVEKILVKCVTFQS